MFGAPNDINVFTVKISILHYIADYLQRLGDVRYFDASAFEQLDLVISQFIE